MNNLEKIKIIIGYIEANLTNNFTLEDLSIYTGYSLYYIHRIFSQGFGDSIKDYISKRRISKAAYELVYTDKSILNIAMDYCYNSQEVFSRAFFKVYNLNPGEFRKKGFYYSKRDKLDIYNINFEYDREINGLNPKIVTLPNLELNCISLSIEVGNTVDKEIPIFWLETGFKDHLFKDNTSDIYSIIYIRENKLLYSIGFISDEKLIKNYNISCYTINSNKYAIFTIENPLIESIHKTWNYIWNQWLPNSCYKHKNRPELERYYKIHNKKYVDICVPI